ncbi:MAG: hypothetical protein DI599_20565 [Pseudomonas kuykendallii]|uniref:Uncharacterized protein n=1 Tax=Pseudomonas kuykendallii TaxID=1007099 RepID=A0A2W5CPB3_9PSED|nr:MAG: hypothetical protein DI599_20565 [Pseudomonas kuykendallii]
MKAVAFTLTALAVGVVAAAEEPKPIATQTAEAMAPVANAIGSTFTRTLTEFMAGSDGMLGKAARSNLKMQDKRERIANRGVRKSMKECIKPGNIIDDDVKECTEGLKEKSW